MDDLISRQAAIDAFDTEGNELIVAGKENADAVEKYLKTVMERIEQLPSAEPGSGKWIDANICGELPVIVCDQCHTFFPIAFGDFHNFCPNCGAKMEVTE